MNYLNIYNQLVEKAKPRGLKRKSVDYYTEIHHIIPRSMGGSNDRDNLVMLSAREHYIAHMLLWKAYPESSALKYAASMMSNRAVCKVNSYIYAHLKEDFSKAVSEKRRGKCYKDLVGQRFTKLVVLELADFYVYDCGSRQAQWLCQCDCGNITTVVSGSLTSKNTQSCGCLVSESGKMRTGENNHMFGKKHSEETKAKFKLRPVRCGEDNPLFGTKWSEERRKEFSEARKGIPWTEERKASAVFPTGEDHHFFGKSHSEESRKKISEILKSKNQRPWQNLATQTEESLLKWAMCDYYYNLWIEFDKPGLKRFTKIYNETHNDNASLAFFTNPRLHFMDGWIPANDEEWLEFSRGYL